MQGGRLHFSDKKVWLWKMLRFWVFPAYSIRRILKLFFGRDQIDKREKNRIGAGYFLLRTVLPDGGTAGGEVVFTGTAAEMAERGRTITAEYLRKSL